jgi:hypothetical protein
MEIAQSRFEHLNAFLDTDCSRESFRPDMASREVSHVHGKVFESEAQGSPGLSHLSVCFPFGRGNVFMFFILAMYSGYIVSAPPRDASGGIP